MLQNFTSRVMTISQITKRNTTIMTAFGIYTNNLIMVRIIILNVQINDKH